MRGNSGLLRLASRRIKARGGRGHEVNFVPSETQIIWGGGKIELHSTTSSRVAFMVSGRRSNVRFAGETWSRRRRAYASTTMVPVMPALSVGPLEWRMQ